jgi:hypothetical protein
MPRWGRSLLVLGAVLALWAGFAWTVSRPDDFAAYSRTIGQVAESTHDATRTGWLVGRQQLAGRLTATFAATAYADAGRTIAGAQQLFARAVAPDRRAMSLRDQLGPLLAEAVADLADAAGANDRAALASAVDRLGSVADRLDTFIGSHR